MLTSHAIRGRGGKDSLVVASQQTTFHLLWRLTGVKGSLQYWKIALTSAGPLREAEQKLPEGRQKSPRVKWFPSTEKVDHIVFMWSINSLSLR